MYASEAFWDKQAKGFNILHLLKDSRETVKQIHRLLKPGGIFISSTTCPGKRKNILGGLLLVASKIKILPHINFFGTSELQNLITDESFSIVELRITNDAFPSCYITAMKM